MMVTKCDERRAVVLQRVVDRLADLVRDLHLHDEPEERDRRATEPKIHLCASTIGIDAAQPRLAAVGVDVARAAAGTAA